MRHRNGFLAVLAILAVTAVAAGCASATASTRPARPAQLAATAHALAHSHSVAFDATVNLGVSAPSAGTATPAAALAGGTTTLKVQGEMTRTTSGAAASATFTLANGLLPVSGELRWPGGTTVYVRSALLGSGWHSYRVPIDAISHHAQGLAPANRHPGGHHPATAGMLSPVTVTSSGSSQTFAASIRPAGFATMLASMLPANVPHSFTHVLRAAHGTLTVDRTTHLPTAAHLSLDAVTPASEVHAAQGISGIHLDVDVSFSHWNAPVHITAPAGATPLHLSQLNLPGGLPTS